MNYSSLLKNNYIDDFESIVPAIEAVIFASEEPVSLEKLLELFNVQTIYSNKSGDNKNKNNKKNKAEKARHKLIKKEAEVKKKVVLKAIEAIKNEFNEKGNHGIYLSVNDSGISFKTKPEYFDVITGSLKVKPLKFTGPQLETLSIIAYKQPVTKNEIDLIRGFDSASTVKFLLEKNLIKVAGRKEIVGRPLIYKTTDYFIGVFNLKNLNDLPSVKEMKDVIKQDDLSWDNADNTKSENGGPDNGETSEEKETPLFK